MHLPLVRCSRASLQLLLLGALACPAVTGVSYHRVIGFVSADREYKSLEVPDSVTAGIPFTVTVATYGSSCLRPDGAEVSVVGMVAEIIAYDREPRGDIACPDDWRAFPRAVTVVLPTPGAGVVRLQGRGGVTVEEPVTVVTGP